MASVAASHSGSAHLLGRWGRVAVIGVPMVFLLLVFLLPFLVVFKISVSEMDTVFFKDVLSVKDDMLVLALRYGNYISLTQDALYLTAYLSSIKIAAITTAICLCIAYPFAYFWRAAQRTGVRLC